MSNPTIPKTNANPGPGAPPSLLLAELASNRSNGEIYLGTDTGIRVVGEPVNSISRGGTAATTAAAALTNLGAAPIDSPAFTNTPTAPTAAVGTNSTQLATTAFVQSNRGDKYLTTSTTSWTIGKGQFTFTVDSGLSYTPTQDVTVVYNLANHAHGQVVSYTGTSLVVDIQNTTGNGTHASWTINVGGLSTASGALLQANNLSDVANAATALTNLGGVSTNDTINIQHGGTNATTQQAALNNLAGGVTNLKFLGGDGSNVTLRSIAASDLPNSGVLGAVYGDASSKKIPALTVDQYGRVTFATEAVLNLTTSDIANFASAASAAAPIQSAVTSLTAGTGLDGGTITSTGTISLATSGVAAATYGSAAAKKIPALTLDQYGRVTFATEAVLNLTTSDIQGYNAGGGVGSVTSITAGTGLAGGTITSTGTISLATSGVAAATYGSAAARKIPALTIDQYGRTTFATEAALNLTTSDIAGFADAISYSAPVQSNTSGMTGATSISNIVQITQAGYNALTPSSSTLYIIVG